MLSDTYFDGRMVRRSSLLWEEGPVVLGVGVGLEREIPTEISRQMRTGGWGEIRIRAWEKDGKQRERQILREEKNDLRVKAMEGKKESFVSTTTFCFYFRTK